MMPLSINIDFYNLTFTKKLMKRPTTFITYFQSTCYVVNIHKVLPSQNFCKKNGSPVKIHIYFCNFEQFLRQKL